MSTKLVRIRISKEGVKILKGDVKDIEKLDLKARKLLVEVYFTSLNVEKLKQILRELCELFKEVPAYVVLEEEIKDKFFIGIRNNITMILPKDIDLTLFSNIREIISLAKKSCVIKVYNLNAIDTVKKLLKKISLESLIVQGNIVISDDALNILCTLPIKRLYLEKSEEREILYDAKLGLLFIRGTNICVNDLRFIEEVIKNKLEKIHVKGIAKKYYNKLLKVPADDIFISVSKDYIIFLARKVVEIRYEGKDDIFTSFLDFARKALEKKRSLRLKMTNSNVVIESPPYRSIYLENPQETENTLREIMKV